MKPVNQNNGKSWLVYAKESVLLAIIISAFFLPATVKAASFSDFWNILSNFSKNTISTQPVIAADQTEIPAKEEEKPSVVAEKPDITMDAVITAYSSTPDQTDSDPFIAASGKRVHEGMIAANGMPFGTRIKIPSLYGDRIFLVEDRMNARYGYGRMDIWMDAPKAELYKFGVKRVMVEVYYPEKLKKNADQLMVAEK